MANKKHTKDKEEPKTIELEQMNIFMLVPKEAVSLEITARLLDENGELMKVSRKLSVSDIRDARQAFLDNVEDGDDYDARYVLTAEGRACMDRLVESGGDCD